MTPSELEAPDPAARVHAIRGVRFRDLKDPAVLEALLACTHDTTPAPGEEARTADPFADFFGAASPTATPVATIGQVAVERLQRAGLPPTLETAEALARALAEAPDHSPLPATAATLLAETRWDDLEGVLRAVLPPLQRLDVPLYAVVARLPAESWPTLCELATAPWVPRTFNELLNHPPVRPLAVSTLEAADEAGTLGVDANAAASLLGTLQAWSEGAALRLAERWADRWPWTVAFAALDDPRHGEPLAAWLAGGAPSAPEVLPAVLGDTLRHRGHTEGYPLSAVLAWLGRDPGLVDVWGIDDAVAAVLIGWSVGVADGDLRAWDAVRLLASDGRLPAVADDVEAALADPDVPVPWDPDILTALATAETPPPSLPAALARGVAVAPAESAVAAPALHALGPEDRRPALEALLAAAEAADEVEEPAGRGTVRVARAGVDVEALAPLAEALDDADLHARLDAVLPVVRGR